MDYIEDSLRQNRFWLRIMSEHALFIRLGLPCYAADLINQAQNLQNLFEQLKVRADNTPPVRGEVFNLNQDVIAALDRIIPFKSDLLTLIITCNIGGSNIPLLIDHIRREAIRFRNILIRLQDDIQISTPEEMLQEEIFWLRIMGEHAKFVAQLLDPSERFLVDQSNDFAIHFETLRLQARDLESMVNPKSFDLWLLPVSLKQVPPGVGACLPDPFLIPRLERFNNEVIEATEKIRDFKATALRLIQDCKVLSIIPPLLADHILREAEMALADLRMIASQI
ncbi:MAG: DUF2935 domain-containing protein [Firmicutes bacterium]|nr:DUF2935 domain-containing protein [Bacillota bacterium]